MLSLQNAGKRFGPRVLFLEANWLIRAKERTALVGANGTGKSTLMKVLAGLETLDYGTLQQTRGMRIGYLPQEGLRLTGRTVFEECLTVFDELHEMEREIERLGGQLAVLEHAGPEYESAAERYSMLQERFHALDGYALDAQVGGVLTGLGFGKEDWAGKRTNSVVAGKCALRSQNYCWPSPTCCSSTSPPTTSTSKPATGLRIICTAIRSVTFSSRMIAIFSMSPSTAP